MQFLGKEITLGFHLEAALAWMSISDMYLHRLRVRLSDMGKEIEWLD